MPTYRVISKDGRRAEIVTSVTNYSQMCRGSDDEGYDLVEWEGELWRRDFEGLVSTAKSGAKWPIESMAAGVNPSDVPAEMERCRKEGVAVNFTKDGRAVFENAAHRRAALKVMGLTDRLGYG